MTWVVPLALGGLAVLLMVVFTMLGAKKKHAAQTNRPKSIGPRILVHDINDDRCTGCDACVAVCPTNVLDLVANKSRVLRFEDCIQCEACMFACPTEALVMFPEGAVPPPLKVPELDENFQTVIPGQYLIGEVAGKPLVKSAANLGRAVVEHMMQTGLRGAGGRSPRDLLDVAVIGSGPGGLSTALTCIEKKLSFVVLEKEQDIASTILRYPKGKLVMAEPYDTQNLSFLPVFDASKEQLIPIWRELIERVGLDIKQGESVETVLRQPDGTFEIKTTVATYRAQRVVLSIGTRGKPRTLQVPGENLPKIYSLLEDPADWAGKNVLVVGGGDSAVEASLALADAGAIVTISYRGKGFNRAAPKNKSAVEAYAAEGRIKAKLGSQVLGFEGDSVALALGDGSQKRYPNDAAFVLIGADPPIAWLEKAGIRFVERPHQYQLGKTDDIVRRFVGHRAMDCPEDAPRAAAQILGGSTGKQPTRDYGMGVPAAQPQLQQAMNAVSLPMPMGPSQSGPRKWLRSATSIFSTRAGTGSGTNVAPGNAPINPAMLPPKKKLSGQPVPLSEFVKPQKTGFGPSPSTGVHHMHTGHGRRDQLSAGERTRILRMLRDEGGRLADEDSQVYVGAVPPKPGGFDFDFDGDDDIAPPPAPGQVSIAAPPMLPPPRADVPAKPAQISGLAAAQAKARRDRRNSAAPPPGGKSAISPGGRAMPLAPERLPTDGFDDLASPPMTLTPTNNRAAPPSAGRAKGMTRPPPPRAQFTDEPTRQVDDGMLANLRAVELAAAGGKQPAKPSVHEESTRMVHASEVSRAAKPSPAAPPNDFSDFDGYTVPERGVGGMRPAFPSEAVPTPTSPTRLPGVSPSSPAPGRRPLPPPSRGPVDESGNDEATRMADLGGLAAMAGRTAPAPNDERTRAVDLKKSTDPRAMSDVDWDLDE